MRISCKEAGNYRAIYGPSLFLSRNNHYIYPTEIMCGPYSVCASGRPYRMQTSLGGDMYFPAEIYYWSSLSTIKFRRTGDAVRPC